MTGSCPYDSHPLCARSNKEEDGKEAGTREIEASLARTSSTTGIVSIAVEVELVDPGN